MPIACAKRQMAGLLLLLVSLGLLSQPSVLAGTQKPEAKKVLAYDRTVALDLKEASTTEQDGAVIKDVNYAAYASRHGRIKAYLVKPKGKGPFAGVVYFHWLGRPKGDRTQFLDEAVALAKQGVVSVLIQGYFPWSEPPTDGPTDRQQIIDQTIEARRALDLLLAQKEVDRKRVAYVGHDYGSMYGGIMSGVDKRVKAYVLIAGLGKFSPWSLKYWPKTAAHGNDAYEQAVSPLDPIRYVPHGAPTAFLFQFANTDEYITKDEATAFFDQASKPKEIKWYDAEHDLNVDAARKDRHDWLAYRLGLVRQ
jgi:pimeloyl-ACP methyl ester carboxylesterase